MPESDHARPHIPIMVNEILTHLRVADIQKALWIDGTVGAGGHSTAILATREDSRLLGLDADPEAVKLAKSRLAVFSDRVRVQQGHYTDMRNALNMWMMAEGVQPDGILLDLGLSSMQVDRAERGFSFRQEGSLDMRFNPGSSQPTAEELVNTLPQDALVDIFFQYGEEPHSRRIARAIVAAREQAPIRSTTQLAEIVAAALPIRRKTRQKQKIHPATLVFQALRIAVNEELQAVERVLPLAIELLKPGGRLAVISFHSLEDRIVKQTFKAAATVCICPPRQPVCTCDHHASVTLITRKPLMPGESEVEKNPRARSARLRVIEKLPVSPES